MYQLLQKAVRYSARIRLSATLFAVGLMSLVVIETASAATLPANLGNGLDKVVQAKSKIGAFQNSAVSDQGNAMFALAITDAQGRVLVRINPRGATRGKPAINVHSLAVAIGSNIASVEVTAIDDTYRGVGVMDAWVGVDDVVALATTDGVRSVILELKPRLSRSAGSGTSASNGDAFTKIGTTFDQGVFQHRVDQINKTYNPLASLDYEGQGMSIGFISNSYAANSTHTAATDVANFDLPGSASNPVNTTPVFVLQDDTSNSSSDDEGRGMVQIGYKMAPKAALGFATADGGEVGFANNIRGLANFGPAVVAGQTFSADAICDDVGYYDEPFFQDGIIGAAVNDVTATGVTYFSSAANDIGINGYDSDLRWVANGTGMTASGGNLALAGTNIDLTNVPANLYAGGFHNFNPNPNALDVAQLVNVATNSNEPPTILQWDEPYDQSTEPDYVQPPIFTAHNTFTNTAQTYTVTASVNAGTLYEVDSIADAGSTFDSIVSITDPNGNIIVNRQDTGTDETVRFFAPVTGTGYVITIDHYGTTTGPYTVTMYATHGFPGQTISTDINLLVFSAAGVYLPNSSLTTNNFATNEPIEVGYTLRATSTQPQVQYVIARSNANGTASHVRYLIPGNGLSGVGPAEYFTYNTVTTGGHAMAEGTNGVAAYSVFRPSLPEYFTSPGPVHIYYDEGGNRLPLPTVRQQPRFAAADGANISTNEGQAGLGSDSSSDSDTNGNFFGTSAAAPHAAAIAALVLQAHGGPRSLTPAQMTTILETNTFQHDLDPSYASGFARTSNGDFVKITINSDYSSNATSGLNDANSFAVSYQGQGGITSLTFNPNGNVLTGGNVSGGNNGYTDVASPAITYFENSFPGMVFSTSNKPFTVGTLSTVASASVTPSFSNNAPAPASTLPLTMGLTFDGTFTSGNTLRFTVGRAVAHSSVVNTAGGTGSTGGTAGTNYYADLFGGGVSLPSGTVTSDGMTFSGTTSSGGTFSGVLRNRVQQGYSPVDGYGFINAQSAVGASVQ